jgi:hypothetical protein
MATAAAPVAAQKAIPAEDTWNSGDPVQVALSLKINGRSYSVRAPHDMPLLWVLRDLLNLKGTKVGCGIAQCGPCTVHVDSRPVPSCAPHRSAPRPRKRPMRGRRSRLSNAAMSRSGSGMRRSE